jgi:hypothetical protein
VDTWSRHVSSWSIGKCSIARLSSRLVGHHRRHRKRGILTSRYEPLRDTLWPCQPPPSCGGLVNFGLATAKASTSVALAPPPRRRANTCYKPALVQPPPDIGRCSHRCRNAAAPLGRGVCTRVVSGCDERGDGGEEGGVACGGVYRLRGHGRREHLDAGQSVGSKKRWSNGCEIRKK